MKKLTRFEYNLKIIDKLKELIIKYPDMRFGQILVNTDIIQVVSNESGIPVIQDPFYEEPEITWKRVKNNKFAFKELYN